MRDIHRFEITDDHRILLYRANGSLYATLDGNTGERR